MEILQDLDEMRKVLSRRLIMMQLRPRGIGSIIFGVIAVFMGITGISENPLNAVLALIGGFLLFEGVWFLAAPSARGFIIDGCALIGLGAWNIFVTVQNMSAGSGSTHFAVLGIFQIFWGFQSFSFCTRASESLSVTTSQEAIKTVDDLVNTVLKSNFKKNPNYIEIFQKSFFIDQPWKCVLMDDVAVLVAIKTRDGVIARKDEFLLIQKGKHSAKKLLKATLKTGDREMPVIIQPKSLERLQEWKPEVVVVPTV